MLREIGKSLSRIFIVIVWFGLVIIGFASSSADEEKIFFVRSIYNLKGEFFEESRFLCAIDADGGNERQITELQDSQNVLLMTPDCRQIFLKRYGSLSVMDIEGKNEKQLTDMTISDPAFSADYRKIAFSSGSDIYTMDVEGSNVKQLTSGREPKWSPDGKQIVFTRLGSPIITTDGIYVINADGSDVR